MENDPFDPSPEWCYFTAEDTLGGLFSIYVNGSEVAQQLGLNISEHSDATIGEMAGMRSESVESLLRSCATQLRTKPNVDDEDWAEYSVPDLIEHIKIYHHRMTYSELGRLSVLMEALHDVNVGEHQSNDADHKLCQVKSQFADFGEHLKQHLEDEEQRLFPQWLQYDGRSEPSTAHYQRVDREVRVIEHHHEDLAEDFNRIIDCIHELGHIYSDSDVQRALIEGAERLREDLILHAYKEDEYLMPALLYMRELNRRRYRYLEET